MARSWITPKTNWDRTDKVEYSDYNRIRNNLLYINDTLNEMYPDKAQTLDLGDALTYSANYLPSQFNAFEDALESFTRIGVDVNIGAKKTFSGNDPFITYNELNRIENCCLKWYNYDPVIHVSSISISPSSASIKVGETKTFTVTCLPTNAEDVNDWIVTSSNTSIMTVVKSGTTVIATAVGVGTATINVSVYNSSASASLTVEPILVEQIILEESEFNIPFWSPVYFGLTLLPANATNINDWTISSNNALIVSARKETNNQFRLMGGRIGQATITIKCGNVSVSANVTVLNTADAIWISTVRGGSLKVNSARIDGIGRQITDYVVTNPLDAMDKDEFTYTVSNPQCISVTRNSDALTIETLSAGTSHILIALDSGMATWDYVVEVRDV